MTLKQIGAALLAGAFLLLCACDFSPKPDDTGSTAASVSPSSAPASETARISASQAPSETETSVAVSSEESVAMDESVSEALPDKGQEMREEIEAMQPDDQAIYEYAPGQQLALIPAERECPVGANAILAQLYNAGDSTFDYAGDDQDYRLEKLVDGEWKAVPGNRDTLSPSYPDTLEAYKIRLKAYDLSIWQAAWLSAGQFRITDACRRADETYGLTFYFSLYGEGDPWDSIKEEATDYGDQYAAWPDGDVFLLAPEKRICSYLETPFIYAYYYNQSDHPVDITVSAAFTLEKKEQDGWREIPGTAFAWTPEKLSDAPDGTGIHTMQPYHQLEIVFPLDPFDTSKLSPGDYRISIYALGEEKPPLTFHFSMTDITGVITFDHAHETIQPTPSPTGLPGWDWKAGNRTA